MGASCAFEAGNAHATARQRLFAIRGATGGGIAENRASNF
jgi:hypothetical protein